MHFGTMKLKAANLSIRIANPEGGILISDQLFTACGNKQKG